GCIEPCRKSREEPPSAAPPPCLPAAFKGLTARCRPRALHAFRKRLPVAGEGVRHQLKPCRHVRPLLFCGVRHLVEHLANVLERARDIVQVPEVLTRCEEVEVDAEPLEHDATRDSICPY